MKPTYGLVSARGVVPLSWSYDHVGPMTRSVRDAALVLQAIAGYDAGDITSRELPESDYGEGAGAGHAARCASESCASFSSTIWSRRSRPPSTTRSRCWKRSTSGLSDASMPIDTDRTVQAAEAYAYHAQFLAERAELYQPETLRRIQRGESVYAPGNTS